MLGSASQIGEITLSWFRQSRLQDTLGPLVPPIEVAGWPWSIGSASDTGEIQPV